MMLVNMLDELETAVYAAKCEAEKFEVKGNNAAGARVRKLMLEVKNQASQIRKTVSEMKNNRK